ncbi:MAG: ABC transporter ATP-binding protein [Endomicrobiia bacterium]
MNNTAPNKMSHIELKNVTKLYNRGIEEIHAVDKINLSITKGDFLSIVGPSGSGKTTLLNIIGCLDHPTGGEVIINGQEVSKMNENNLIKIRRKTIGFVFQQFFLIPTLTALENVEIPGLFANNKQRIKKAEELLNLFGLEKRKNHFPSQLSGGEMQRVAIARALINSPQILLADEPTGNLDSKNAQEVFSLFSQLNKNGLTIVIVTHNIELAKMTNKIVELNDGKIK